MDKNNLSGQKDKALDRNCLILILGVYYIYYRVFHVAGILEVVEEQKITDVNLKAWIQCLEEGHQARIYVSKHTQTKVEGYVAVRYQFDWMNQAWTTKMRNKSPESKNLDGFHLLNFSLSCFKICFELCLLSYI